MEIFLWDMKRRKIRSYVFTLETNQKYISQSIQTAILERCKLTLRDTDASQHNMGPFGIDNLFITPRNPRSRSNVMFEWFQVGLNWATIMLSDASLSSSAARPGIQHK